VAGGRVVASTNLYHTSRIYFDASNQFSQGSYDILSARLEWTDPSDRITVAVYGDNLLDAEYYTQLLSGQAGVGTVWGEPAIYGFSVRYNFGA
jgi:iron complex outermembrane receptor protein